MWIRDAQDWGIVSMASLWHVFIQTREQGKWGFLKRVFIINRLSYYCALFVFLLLFLTG